MVWLPLNKNPNNATGIKQRSRCGLYFFLLWEFIVGECACIARSNPYRANMRATICAKGVCIYILYSDHIHICIIHLCCWLAECILEQCIRMCTYLYFMCNFNGNVPYLSDASIHLMLFFIVRVGRSWGGE